MILYSGYEILNRDDGLQWIADEGVRIKWPARIDFDHITYRHPARELPPPAAVALILGVASNARIQALLVQVNKTWLRPGGGFFHITLSMADGVKAVESNTLFANAFAGLIPVTMFKRTVTINIERFLREVRS